MRAQAGWLLICFISISVSTQIELSVAAEAEHAAESRFILHAKRAETLFRMVRCPVCATQSIAESDVEVSKSLRDFIRAKIENGKSDAQILEALSARYGASILLKPPVTAETILLWSAPWVFAAGAFAVWIAVHRKRRSME